MTSNKWVLNILFLFVTIFSEAQTKKIDINAFFDDKRPLKVTISTDIKDLVSAKKSLKSVNATLTINFPDSNSISDSIKIKHRGNFRKENCYLASLMLQFNNTKSSNFYPFKRLKLVGGCGKNKNDEQYLLKEYMVYQLYNLLTNYSFRVRLMEVNYIDIKNKVKPYSQYAFVLEDIDDVAKRNKCQEKKFVKATPNSTKSSETILVAMFQYMIGNTDWSIPFFHNIKLLVPKKDTNSIPIPVAYDFDVSGFVNPPYAEPPPDMGIEKVTQRLYRGFPKPIEDLQVVINLFLQKENEIYSLINDFELLNQTSKKEMHSYLEDFFKTIKNENEVKSVFITNARKN
jgi:hypothetical protein